MVVDPARVDQDRVGVKQAVALVDLRFQPNDKRRKIKHTFCERYSFFFRSLHDLTLTCLLGVRYPGKLAS